MSEFRFFTLTDFDYEINATQTVLRLPFDLKKNDNLDDDDDGMSEFLNIPYTVFEILVAIFAVVGNLMVIIVFQRERKLRRRTNYYIVSLAMADFLVGSLGVPFAILSSVGKPRNLYACLFTVSLLVVLCTISIFCLVAVSVDRYWAILYPMAYSRNVRTKTAIIIISMCWVAGTVVGFLPLFGWHADVGQMQTCHFVKVMDYNYLVFLYFATIITPALLMLAFYAHIYRVIVKQVRQIVTMNPVGDSRRSSTAQIQTSSHSRPCHGGTMLRVLGASRKRDVKATQNLSIIVLFFMLCWFPLYTINCIKAFCPDCEVPPKLTLFCIILSHLNSAVNPVLYAYHLKDFRAALKNFILKIMGVDIEPQAEAIHRFSLASQHRLQSIDANMRSCMQPRIYIDSPIWLRQQQQTLKNPQLVPKCGVVTPCLNNIHHTVAAVAAVASVTTDIEREMWNIMEASSGAELAEVNYEFPTSQGDNTPPVPPPRHNRRSSLTSGEHCDSSYSYDNCNYFASPDEETELDEVFLPIAQSPRTSAEQKQLNDAHIACTMRDKLRSDDADYQLQLHSNQCALTDSSYSNYELPKNAAQTPPVNGKIAQGLVETKPPTSTACHNNAGVYVIDSDDRTPLSPGNKRKLKKSPRLPMNLARTTKTISRSCSCTSDSSSPTKELPPQPPTTCSDSNSSSTLSVVGNGGSGGVGFGDNNNTNHTNNLNYYTFHHPHQHTLHPHAEKFSPLKAVSNLIFPPIVKHSSLFHLFQPNVTSNECSGGGIGGTTTSTSITAAIAATTTTAAAPITTTDAAPTKLTNDLTDISAASAEVVEPAPTLLAAADS